MRRPHVLLIRRRRTRCLLVALALSACSVVAAPPAAAAQTIGFPTFGGPAIPAPPVAHTPGEAEVYFFDDDQGIDMPAS